MALLATVVRKALRSVKDPSPVDVAVAELAIAYAKTIDESAQVAGALAEALRQVAELDIELHDQLLPLAAQIERTVERAAVLEKLGPKLLAALDALLITPKSRAAVRRGVKDAAKRANPLDQLMDRRAARERNPSPVDPSAP